MKARHNFVLMDDPQFSVLDNIFEIYKTNMIQLSSHQVSKNNQAQTLYDRSPTLHRDAVRATYKQLGLNKNKTLRDASLTCVGLSDNDLVDFKEWQRFKASRLPHITVIGNLNEEEIEHHKKEVLDKIQRPQSVLENLSPRFLRYIKTSPIDHRVLPHHNTRNILDNLIKHPNSRKIDLLEMFLAEDIIEFMKLEKHIVYTRILYPYEAKIASLFLLSDFTIGRARTAIRRETTAKKEDRISLLSEDQRACLLNTTYRTRLENIGRLVLSYNEHNVGIFDCCESTALNGRNDFKACLSQRKNRCTYARAGCHTQPHIVMSGQETSFSTITTTCIYLKIIETSLGVSTTKHQKLLNNSLSATLVNTSTLIEGCIKTRAIGQITNSENKDTMTGNAHDIAYNFAEKYMQSDFERAQKLQKTLEPRIYQSHFMFRNKVTFGVQPHTFNGVTNINSHSTSLNDNAIHELAQLAIDVKANLRVWKYIAIGGLRSLEKCTTKVASAMVKSSIVNQFIDKDPVHNLQDLSKRHRVLLVKCLEYRFTAQYLSENVNIYIVDTAVRNRNMFMVDDELAPNMPEEARREIDRLQRIKDIIIPYMSYILTVPDITDAELAFGSLEYWIMFDDANQTKDRLYIPRRVRSFVPASFWDRFEAVITFNQDGLDSESIQNDEPKPEEQDEDNNASDAVEEQYEEENRNSPAQIAYQSSSIARPARGDNASIKDLHFAVHSHIDQGDLARDNYPYVNPPSTTSRVKKVLGTEVTKSRRSRFKPPATLTASNRTFTMEKSSSKRGSKNKKHAPDKDYGDWYNKKLVADSGSPVKGPRKILYAWMDELTPAERFRREQMLAEQASCRSLSRKTSGYGNLSINIVEPEEVHQESVIGPLNRVLQDLQSSIQDDIQPPMTVNLAEPVSHSPLLPLQDKSVPPTSLNPDEPEPLGNVLVKQEYELASLLPQVQRISRTGGSTSRVNVSPLISEESARKKSRNPERIVDEQSPTAIVDIPAPTAIVDELAPATIVDEIVDNLFPNVQHQVKVCDNTVPLHQKCRLESYQVDEISHQHDKVIMKRSGRPKPDPVSRCDEGIFELIIDDSALDQGNRGVKGQAQVARKLLKATTSTNKTVFAKSKTKRLKKSHGLTPADKKKVAAKNKKLDANQKVKGVKAVSKDKKTISNLKFMESRLLRKSMQEPDKILKIDLDDEVISVASDRGRI